MSRSWPTSWSSTSPRAVAECTVDGTLGAGGHAERVLEAAADVRLIGIDRDPAALAIARERLARFAARVTLVHATYEDVERVLSDHGVPHVDGLVLDLGLSSIQLDEAERGFSFARPGPIDMRMDPSGDDPTALDLIRRVRRRGAFAHPARPGRGALPQANRAPAQGGGARRRPGHDGGSRARGRGVHPGAAAAADAHPRGHADRSRRCASRSTASWSSSSTSSSASRTCSPPAAAASSSASTRSRTAW